MAENTKKFKKINEEAKNRIAARAKKEQEEINKQTKQQKLI